MQRAIHAITLALFMLACAWTIGSHGAVAQPSNCCTYTIDVGLGASAENCLPITIVGDFGPGGRDTVTITGDGLVNRNVPGPCPAYLLNWISVDGSMPISAVGERTYSTGDCCYKFTFILDQDLCQTILIRPCDGLR